MPGLLDALMAEREHACRLVPDRALETLDDAEAFLTDRGVLTLTRHDWLPSLFEACHEPPADPAKGGFAQWPATKWWWGGELASRQGVHLLPLLKGRTLYLSDAIVVSVDRLCRSELERADEGDHGEDALTLVRHLNDAGPALVDDVKQELGFDAKRLRSIRTRLERVGAVVSTGVVIEGEKGHIHTSRLARWDQCYSEGKRSAPAGLRPFVAHLVAAAVVVPEPEVRKWISWKVTAGDIDALVESGAVTRPAPGWVARSD